MTVLPDVHETEYDAKRLCLACKEVRPGYVGLASLARANVPVTVHVHVIRADYIEATCPNGHVQVWTTQGGPHA
jgi:hypothetical protein